MKIKSRFFLSLCLIVLAAAAGGCVMAARKGEQRLEERDGPVGNLLGEARETLRGHPGPTPAERP